MMFVPSAAARTNRVAGLRWLLLAGVLALNACRTPPPPPPQLPPAAPPAPVIVPERIDHYRVDDEASQVLILVYRDGRMARLGHNHVLRVRQLSGEVVVPKDTVNTTFTLEFPVAASRARISRRRSTPPASTAPAVTCLATGCSMRRTFR